MYWDHFTQSAWLVAGWYPLDSHVPLVTSWYEEVALVAKPKLAPVASNSRASEHVDAVLALVLTRVGMPYFCSQVSPPFAGRTEGVRTRDVVPVPQDRLHWVQEAHDAIEHSVGHPILLQVWISVHVLPTGRLSPQVPDVVAWPQGSPPFFAAVVTVRVLVMVPPVPQSSEQEDHSCQALSLQSTAQDWVLQETTSTRLPQVAPEPELHCWI